MPWMVWLSVVLLFVLRVQLVHLGWTVGPSRVVFQPLESTIIMELYLLLLEDLLATWKESLQYKWGLGLCNSSATTDFDLTLLY